MKTCLFLNRMGYVWLREEELFDCLCCICHQNIICCRNVQLTAETGSEKRVVTFFHSFFPHSFFKIHIMLKKSSEKHLSSRSLNL